MQAHQGITCYLFPNTLGKPMKNNPFAIAQKYLDKQSRTPTESRAATVEGDPLPTLRAWVVNREFDKKGELRAVLICSALLEDHLWVVCDRSFEPKDGLAVYYAEEIPLLKGKSLEDLREIHRVKLIFPGCRVIQG